ncbi:MAG: Pnap_2097 family protein [Pseudomonadota bacterium]
MDEVRVFKDDKSGGQRLQRLLGSVFDPRAWAHWLKILNYYNYTHVSQLRQMQIGANPRISPTASFSNGNNIELGNNVRIGANASLWAGSGRARIVVGPDTMIAPNVMITAANYRFDDGSPINDQAMDEADIIIGRDVWVGVGAVILPGVTIGDRAIIGAGAVIRKDVPELAVVTAANSEVAGKRRDAQVWSEGKPALIEHSSTAILAKVSEMAGRDASALSLPLSDCGLDSFELITLRTKLEEAFALSIPDSEWAELGSLEDIGRLPVLNGATEPMAAPKTSSNFKVPDENPSSAASVEMGAARREFALNMPQMALAGLSESWLFKELGDLHWAMVTHFLGKASGAIADDSGSRLYATFTRIVMESDPSLRGFIENDGLAITSGLERFGASFFFGNHRVDGPTAHVTARTMSTFAKYGERGKNTSLIKGTPPLPNADAVPSLSDFPAFGTEYRERRAAEVESEPLFECEYEQLAPHDINGVGLLYFAAYPMIFDLCIERFEGKGFLLPMSTVKKDICYFANAEPTETLVFRLHERSEDGDIIHHTASLSRKSDNRRMAEVISSKRDVGLHVPS